MGASASFYTIEATLSFFEINRTYLCACYINKEKNIMDKERKETGRLSYFSLALTDFLASDHPDKIEDTGLIQARCRMAEERFCEASREGYGVQEAYEEARKELFRGLHFSPYIMTRDIISSLLPDAVEEDAHRISIQMMERHKGIIDSFGITEDSFMGSTEEIRLEKELREGITGYLKENALI